MIITYEVAIKSGTALQVVRLVEGILAEPRKWEGCLDIRVSVENGADTLFVYERWESPEHLEKFLAWRRTEVKSDPLAESGFLNGTPIRRTFKEV